jgi:putative ABC transport system permease protein
VTLAWRELRRRPGRFGAAVAVVTLLVVLLLALGALLDGLYLGSTGALRAQRADLFVYSSDANDSIIRSRIDGALRAKVAGTPRVERVDGLGISLVGATVPGQTPLAASAVIGYARAPTGVPAPPPAGEAWADTRLKASGVRIGQTIGLGPARVQVRVRGWVRDTSYLLQGALWVAPQTWRTVQDASRPDARLAAGTWQVLLATTARDPATVARAIDRATSGASATLTKCDAVLSAPGTRQLRSTFNGIIVVTFAVVALVVALFFALLTLERTAVYGVLKAVGAPTRVLAAGVVVQAVAVALGAFAIGAAITWALLQFVPERVPLLLQGSRVVSTLVGVVVTAVLGGAISLRRIARVDPTIAIGTGT